MLLIKNNKGSPSISLTMTVIAFTLVCVAYILSFADWTLLGVHSKQFDPSAAMTLLGPCFTLYFGRRWTDSNKEEKV